METKTVHFTLGNNFPVVIGNIGQEHLIYKLDIEKAIDTFVSGFSMPRDLAIQVLHGKDLVIRMEDESNIYVTNREESDEYPQIDCKSTIKWFLTNLLEESEVLEKIITKIKEKDTYELKFTFNAINRLLEDDLCTEELVETIQEEIKKQIYYDYNGMSDDEDCNDFTFNHFKSIQYIKLWKETAYKKLKVIKFMIDNEWISEKELIEISNNELSMKKFLNSYMNICNAYNDITFKTTDANTHKVFMNFINQMNVIAEHVDKIHPSDVTVYHDAIWVSPEGLLYGLNGHINTMLHNQIADQLVECGIVEYDKTWGIDTYLEEAGWCKIHDNWIMFDPYTKSRDFTKPTAYLTDAQVKVIAEYLKLHHNGWGKFGFAHHEISFVTFKAMDNIMRNKLFIY